jgi:Protein of unknown function (DUF1254)
MLRVSLSALFICLLTVGCGPSSKVAEDAKELEALETAKDAYIYTYPLMTMEMTRRASTDVAAPEGTSAPMGQFARLRSYPDASFKTVTAPNADTPYTMGWFDTHQPQSATGARLRGAAEFQPLVSLSTTSLFVIPV